MNETNINQTTSNELLTRIVSCLTDALTNNVLAKIEPRLQTLEEKIANINQPDYQPADLFKETIKELAEEMVAEAVKEADIEGKIESEMDGAVENAVDNVDWDDKVKRALERHNIEEMVEEVLDNNLEDKVREVIDNMTVTLSV